MGLLLLDLDNTLLDRDGAFRSAAAVFLADRGLPAAEVDWLASIDASGYRPRSAVRDALMERHPSLSAEDVQEFLDNGAAEHVRLADPAGAPCDGRGRPAGPVSSSPTGGRVNRNASSR